MITHIGSIINASNHLWPSSSHVVMHAWYVVKCTERKSHAPTHRYNVMKQDADWNASKLIWTQSGSQYWDIQAPRGVQHWLSLIIGVPRWATREDPTALYQSFPWDMIRKISQSRKSWLTSEFLGKLISKPSGFRTTLNAILLDVNPNRSSPENISE